MRAVSLVLTLLCLVVAAVHSFESITPYKKYPTNCKDANAKKNGIYKIQVNGGEPFNVYCDAKMNGTGWLVIQRRVNANINFFRNWSAYQQGFGDLDGSFFIGLNKLNALTAATLNELYVYLEDFDGQSRIAHYDAFAIGNEANLYSLHTLGSYSGGAGDALRTHQNMPFSTYDRDNDNSPVNCAADYSGAWWYNRCLDSNLNGEYLGGEYGSELYAGGNCWFQWKGMRYAYKTVQMMIRPRK